ncbi:hypothetical protein L9F63_017365, partial [Diploptera punctata]
TIRIMTLTRTPCDLDTMSLFQDLKLKRRKVDSRCSSDGIGEGFYEGISNFEVQLLTSHGRERGPIILFFTGRTTPLLSASPGRVHSRGVDFV